MYATKINCRRIDNEKGLLLGHVLARVVGLKRIVLPMLPALFGLFTILGVYQSTMDVRLLSQNERLNSEMGRLQTLKFHKSQEVKRIENQIDRIRNEREEELFQARLRLGMLNKGEVVYQFPHGRNGRRHLEDPSR